MENTNKKFKDVYKKSIAMQLRNMGNPIYDAKVNLLNPRLVVYVFEETDKLKEDFDKVKKYKYAQHYK